jgi:hypothetical protein
MQKHKLVYKPFDKNSGRPVLFAINAEGHLCVRLRISRALHPETDEQGLRSLSTFLG